MNLPPIECFTTSTGVQIYRMPVEAFQGFIAYTYLLLGTETPTLVDCGSGMEKSNADLQAALEAVHENFGVSVKTQDIGRIIITHGHIDHHGGLTFIRQQTQNAAVGIHPLDRRILVNYEERVIVATKNLRVYLQRAGVRSERIAQMMEMYGFAKRLIKSERVDFALDEDVEIDGMKFIHTPGHCPGQVCILLGDVMVSADHILNRITPHQAPESITHYTGLGHYLEALQKVKRVSGIRLALGGHEEPITNVYARIDAIRADHEGKLNRVIDSLETADEPLTINDISRVMYPNMSGYNVLLALEEVGAHVEYLYEHGVLAVTNLDEVEKEDNPPLKYAMV